MSAREAAFAQWDTYDARACRPVEEGGFLTPAEADRLFYGDVPGRGRGRFPSGTEAEAKALCASCPWRIPCALKALEHDRRGDFLPFGIVGGLTATERRTIIERERAAAIRRANRRSLSA